MFENKTVLIVGAGASKEVGLPIGNELKSIIADRVNIKFKDGYNQSGGDRTITNALHEYTERGDINPYLAKGWKIASGLHQSISIDNYIDAHHGDDQIELLGKLGICVSILDAERTSSLYLDENRQNYDFSRVSSTWFLRFFQKLTENVARDNIRRALENVEIISFNYDRCVKHYLSMALESYYDLPLQEAQALCRTLKVYHPYGRVGSLLWEQDEPAISFGGKCTPRTLLSLSNSIQTFTEKVRDRNNVSQMRKSVEAADTLIFLGFGFHPQNMSLIKPNTVGNIRRIFYTTIGISVPDQFQINEDLRGWANGGNISIQNPVETTCAGLFDSNWRSIAR